MLLQLAKAEWPLKLRITIMLNAVFWVCYGTLGRHALFPVHEVPMLWLDRAVPFTPEPWSWVYLSYFLFSGGMPWLLPTRKAIRRFVICVGFMMFICFAVFLSLPTQVPRPTNIGSGIAMNWIVNLDGTLNAFPSLHAGFIVSMSALALRVFAVPRWTMVVCGLWFAAISYSTLATRQHYSLDLLAGGIVGWISHWFTWRGATAAAMMPVSKGITSQLGER